MNEATLIPINDPIGLNDWERFNLLVALSFEPKERMKGLAVVSRKARPKVRTYIDRRVAENHSLVYDHTLQRRHNRPTHNSFHQEGGSETGVLGIHILKGYTVDGREHQ